MAFIGSHGYFKPAQHGQTAIKPTKAQSLKSKALAQRKKPISTAQKNANTLGSVIRGTK